MRYDAARALELLRAGTGNADIQFRDGQEEAVRHVVEGRGRLLVVQKTGWGKSFVYFIATKLLRERGNGPTLLVSPLLALMRNQIEAARRMGLESVTINSTNEEEWDAAERRVADDEIDLLIISPERLANERFRERVLSPVSARIGLLVIDEAHCISDWGHDFRPHYRLIERIARSLVQNVRLLATTATANDRVLDDLRDVLGPDLKVIRGDLNRSSLVLQTIRLASQAERLAWLAEQVPRLPGSGIIYALTKRDAGLIARWLAAHGIGAEAYTGDTGERRVDLEQALLANRIKALVATSALGMGFDKPDLAFVIHYQAPGSVVTYYQQVGRAGRGIPLARGVLLSGDEDTDITGFFIDAAFPTREEVGAILDALENEPEGLTMNGLQSGLNIRYGRIQKALQLMSLEVPAPLVREGSKWQLTAATLSETFWERASRLTDLRREEQRQMQEYVALENGHMAFLVRALDGVPDEHAASEVSPLPASVSEEAAAEAVAFLRRLEVPIEPRGRWPAGGMPRYDVKGMIAAELRSEPGRALCIWGDAGWGRLVERGKYEDGRFGDDLVAASLALITRWGPDPGPQWLTCVPSLHHPTLVPDFADRLAQALAIPFVSVLERTEDRPDQKTMANSIQQARNLDGAMAVCEGAVPDGPVLLVDDMVDSRWTLTVAAWLLRSVGSGPVWPFALAQAGNGG